VGHLKGLLRRRREEPERVAVGVVGTEAEEGFRRREGAVGLDRHEGVGESEEEENSKEGGMQLAGVSVEGGRVAIVASSGGAELSWAPERAGE